jgi:predicted nucleotidyltransferase component of viral defense system
MQNEILTKKQVAFLEKMGESDFLVRQFYLSGGTALAAFYLQHRYSEDLDFFSESEFDVLGIHVFLKSIKKELGIEKVDFQQSYNRNLFFLHVDGEILKTEFTYFPFPRIEKGQKEYGIEIDSLLDIASNKLFTIYQRTKARDYIDLYVICKEKGFSIDELIKKAKAKFDWHIDPLQLGTQFLKAKEAEDYPRMIREVPLAEWQGFFEEEAKKLGKEVVE